MSAVTAVRWCRRLTGLALVLIVTAVVSGGREATRWRRLASGAPPCGGDAGDEEQTEHDHTLEGTLAFLFTCFGLCCVLEHVNHIVPFRFRFPVSIVTYVVGTLLGVLTLEVLNGRHRGNMSEDLVEGLVGAASFDPHALLYLVLPPLLYESAASMKWRVLRKVLPSSVLLALPGVILNTFLTGFFVRVAIRVNGEAPSWETAWLLSSILSATDPVAVVASLAALGAPPKLAALVEGESLLNDGSAVVCVYVFRDWVMGTGAPAKEKFCPDSPPAPSCIVHYFTMVAFGGCAIGLTMGYIMARWIRNVRTHYMPVLELAIVLTAIYGTFFAAEAFHMSGVLAVVTLGFMMSASINLSLSHEGRHGHHVILAQLGYASNQVAFLAAGIISARFMWTNAGCASDHTASHMRAWFELGGLYVTIHLTRGCVVAVFWPLLRRAGYGLTWKEGAILVYGGLRGAVGLVMSLIVEHNRYIDPSISQMVAFHTSGIVLLTLLVNGSTVDEVYRKLNMYPQNPFRRTYLLKVLSKLEGECQKFDIRQISKDWFFKDCLFSQILHGVPNFAHIEFNISGVPEPDGILHLTEVLKALEVDANRHRQEFARERSSHTSNFEANWKHEKKIFDFVQLIVHDKDVSPDKKDKLLRCVGIGDHQLSFSAPSGSPLTGLYVSYRALGQLASVNAAIDDDNEGEEAESETVFQSFSLHLTRVDKVCVVVGLLADVGDVRGVDTEDLEPYKSSQVLGGMPGSIGINFHTGLVHYNGSAGSGTVQVQREPTDDANPGETKLDVRVGMKVSVKVHRQPGCDWQVTFVVSEDGTTVASCACCFGPYTPQELFPAVEFIPKPPPKEGRRMRRALSLIDRCNGPDRSSIRSMSTGLALMRTFERSSIRTRSSVGMQIVPEPENVPTMILPGVPGRSTSSMSYTRRTNRFWSRGSQGSVAGAAAMAVESCAENNNKVEDVDRAAIPPPAPHGDSSSDSDAAGKNNEVEELQSTDPARKRASSTRGISVGVTWSSEVSSRNAHSVVGELGMGSGPSEPAGHPHLLGNLFGPSGSSCSLAKAKDGSKCIPSNRSSARNEVVEPEDTPKENCNCMARVGLSYEPQLTSQTESTNEIFNVLFNTVLHRYNDMYEHGLLGDVALGWLTDSVGEALDCAQNEVNALSARSFKSATVNSGNTTKFVSCQNVPDQAAARQVPIVGGIFEPLIVEYLSLEAKVSRTDVWDRFPARWEKVRQMGYHSTRAKVDALWAFVVAHEKVVTESPTLDRFPRLVRCIKGIVTEVKGDLKLLEELEPGRYFYAKHLLALRVLMNKRLSKLQRYTNEGWLTPADGEGLMHALHERIVQVDLYYPQLHTVTRTAPIERRRLMGSAWGDTLGIRGSNRYSNALESAVSFTSVRSSDSRGLSGFFMRSSRNSDSETSVDGDRAPKENVSFLARAKQKTVGMSILGPAFLGKKEREGHRLSTESAASARARGSKGSPESDSSFSKRDASKCSGRRLREGSMRNSQVSRDSRITIERETNRRSQDMARKLSIEAELMQAYQG